MRRSIARALVAGLTLLGGVAACNADNVNTHADRPANSSSAASGKANSPAHLGQPITISGNSDGSKVRVTAVQVVDPAKSSDDFLTPDAGKHYVAVQFRLQNVGDAAYSDSPSNGAKVIDTKGQQFDASIAENTTAGPVLPAQTKIAPGGDALGFIVFEVPDGSTLAKVQFSMDSGFGETAEWALS